MVAEERTVTRGERLQEPVRLSFDDLCLYTNNFTDENFLVEFQYGKVFRGEIPSDETGKPPKPVTVKVWEPSTQYAYYIGDNPWRLIDEVVFLQSEGLKHPGLMKLYGYSIETESQWCAVVYDFKPLDSLCNLFHNENFKWPERVKVALGLARLLAFLHARHPDSEERPLIIRNLSVVHILVDEDWNPKLYDFSMISGGIFPDRTQLRKSHVKGCCGFAEPNSGWCQRSDVFAFGVMLFCLMTNIYNTEAESKKLEMETTSIEDRVYGVYAPEFLETGVTKNKEPWVLETLKDDPEFHVSDGRKMTELAILCTEWIPSKRCSMEHAVACLEKLKVTCLNSRLFGLPAEPECLKNQEWLKEKARARRRVPFMFTDWVTCING